LAFEYGDTVTGGACQSPGKNASPVFMNEFALTAPKPMHLPRPLAKRSAIDPFIVMDVMGEANAREIAGDDIIHMEVGQPATPAPRAARERAKQALGNERLGYTEALGLPALRERIARHMTERYGVDVRPERVVATAGSSAGFVLAFLAVLDAGDSFGLPSPGYPC
jgi:aspartate/methionine/tyrosine aminotransferase